jgi:hypothetical protein
MAKNKPALLPRQDDKPISRPADQPADLGKLIIGGADRKIAEALRYEVPQEFRYEVPPWLQEQNRQLKKMFEGLQHSIPKPQRPIPKPQKKKRKSGAGRPSVFTKEEVAKVRPAYEELLLNEPGVDDEAAAVRLRTLVPPAKRWSTNNIRNWQRHIFEPVRETMPPDIMEKRREAQRQKIKALDPFNVSDKIRSSATK